MCFFLWQDYLFMTWTEEASYPVTYEKHKHTILSLFIIGYLDKEFLDSNLGSLFKSQNDCPRNVSILKTTLLVKDISQWVLSIPPPPPQEAKRS